MQYHITIFIIIIKLCNSIPKQYNSFVLLNFVLFSVSKLNTFAPNFVLIYLLLAVFSFDFTDTRNCKTVNMSSHLSSIFICCPVGMHTRLADIL